MQSSRTSALIIKSKRELPIIRYPLVKLFYKVQTEIKLSRLSESIVGSVRLYLLFKMWLKGKVYLPKAKSVT